jgi:predicted Rossmann fold flavoprotein
MTAQPHRLVVIGGGAAGFFCAVNAARMAPGLQVILLEKTDKLLSKVRVSGGGRCNVTHACDDIELMSSRYPRGRHFVRKAFHRFFTHDTIAWFKERGVILKTEADGRMFPVTDDSSTIVECLLRDAGRYRVDIRMRAEVRSVQSKHDGTGFGITLSNGETIDADLLCVAAGGYPKAASFGWLEALGHSVEAPVPSLFTLNAPKHPITALMGVAIPDAKVSVRGTRLEERGPVLITHWGLSGPAVLRLSAWGARILQEREYRGEALINWLPEHSIESLRTLFQDLRAARAGQAVSGKCPLPLPARLWAFLAGQSGIDAETRWNELPGKSLNRLVDNCTHYVLSFEEKTTFKEEFVTAGGIRTAAVDPQTMQSRRLPGLFFAGEILDVDGITGGYNFQHAWTSGYVAAEAIAERCRR